MSEFGSDIEDKAKVILVASIIQPPTKIIAAKCLDLDLYLCTSPLTEFPRSPQVTLFGGLAFRIGKAYMAHALLCLAFRLKVPYAR